MPSDIPTYVPGTDPLTKGTGFSNVRVFATERFGPTAWPDLLAALGPTDRSELQAIVTIGWYSLNLYARLINKLEQIHGSGDYKLVERLGSFEAERDLTTIHRVFLRLANPALIVEEIAKYWGRFHNTGRWETRRLDSRCATGTLQDWGVTDRAMCRELVGYMRRSLELAGGKNVRLDHPRCRVDGAESCVFDARWS